MQLNRRGRAFIAYLAVLLFALLFLYFGNQMAVKGLSIFAGDNPVPTVEATVTQVVSITETEALWGGSEMDQHVSFEALIRDGAQERYVAAIQNTGDYAFGNAKVVREGDKIILSSFSGEWYFTDYVRIDKIMLLGGIFVLLLLLFGRIEGFNAILSLCLTCVAIFAVFIPSILSGKNIYLTSVVVCAYSIAVTLLIVIGFNRKSLAAIAGCFGGVLVIGILTLAMDAILGLSGLLNEESLYLLTLFPEKPIDLRAIIFAGIIIGAVGAVMDVAMSIASALWELKTQTKGLGVMGLFRSGIRIGRDVMGTMVNTLILAYIGNSLSVILLLIVYANSFVELVNRELVIVELLQAFVGSLGILLTMPLTALISAFLYSRAKEKKG